MHLDKRLTNDQVRSIFGGYVGGVSTMAECLDLLEIGRSRFFVLLSEYRKNPTTFTCVSKAPSHRQKRITPAVESILKNYLEEDQALIKNYDVPISTYNYTAIKERLEKENNFSLSLPTIINRAKEWEFYLPKRKSSHEHSRQVITTAPGTLLQHDSSIHLFAPLNVGQHKWYLITTIEDFSRLLLYAELIEQETSWSHILAAKDVSFRYGIPFQWYTDQLRVFRYVVRGDMIHNEHYLHTDEVNPQWKQCVIKTGSKVIYALSAEAKGKIERPYRWLQDRVVRRCMQERVTTINEANKILKEEVKRYNQYQVHSTTGEIPKERFETAVEAGLSLFRPFTIPAPYTHNDDIFCFVEKRTTNTYRKINLYKHEISLPSVPKSEEVVIHLAKATNQPLVHTRIWWQNQLVFTNHLPQSLFPKVQF